MSQPAQRQHLLPIDHDPTPAPVGSQRVGIVANSSRPGWRSACEEVQRQLAELGWGPATVYSTTIDDPGAGHARRARENGADLVIAVGGDGTVREVVGALDHTGVHLGIIPLGTANLFARNLLLLRGNLRRQVAVALRGPSVTVDVGVATTRDDTEVVTPERLFLVLAGIGHDARSVAATRTNLKRRLGWVAYFESGSRHLLRRRTSMAVHIDDRDPVHLRAWSVLAGSCGRIPGGVEVFPGALIDDGLLDILVASPANPLQWAGIGAKGLLKLRGDVPGLHYARGRSLVVTPDEPTPVQLDGDYLGVVSEMRVRIDARAVTVRVAEPDLGRLASHLHRSARRSNPLSSN